jgi:hypothetical protein
MRTVATTFVLIACMSIDVSAQGGKAPSEYADEARTRDVEMQRPYTETEDAGIRSDRVINWQRREERTTKRDEDPFEQFNRDPGIRGR